MKIILILFIILVVALGGAYYLRYDIGFEKAIKKTEPKVAVKEVNIQASFAIFTNGTLREFTDSKYHNQAKDVFIQSDNPNIVRVKKEGITWDDFFKTLPMKLSKDCLLTGTKQTFCTDDNKTLRFFLNGKEDKNVLDKEIGNGDKLLVTYAS